MASIPLPALHTAPIQQPPNQLEMLAQAMGIKSAQQEQAQRAAMAPLQQQQAQQAVQSGQLDLEAKQRAAADQKAMLAAMQQWGKGSQGAGSSSSQPSAPEASASAGTAANTTASASGSGMPSYDDLVPLAIKNGASFQAVQGLQSHVLDMKAKASAIAKDDAQAGTANADAMRTKNGIITDAMNGVMSLPDEQLSQGIYETAQELSQKGIFDPQHAQQALELAHMAATNPALARQQINIQSMSLGAFSKELENQQKQLSAQTGQVELQQKQAESQFYKQNGGAPGVSADLMQQADWLKNNPGKGPSDFLVWKNQHAPAVVVQNMNNSAAAGSGAPGGSAIDWGKAAQRYGMTPQAFDQSAEKYFQTGSLPPIGRSPNAIAMNRDLMNRAAELHPGESLAANSAEFKANSESLKKLQINFDQVQAFEGTASKNFDLLQQTAQNIPDLGTRWANIPVRYIDGGMIGTENMAKFKTALNTAQTEAAKVLNSSNATGVLSDSARHELQQIVDGDAPLAAIVGSLSTLKQEFGNRTQSYQQQIADIQTRLKGGAGASQQPAAGSSGAAPQERAMKVNSHGDNIVFKGGQWQIAQ